MILTDINEAVLNPLLRLSQSDGKILYLTEKVAVILDAAGRVVTTYGKDQFASDILNILIQLGK